MSLDDRAQALIELIRGYQAKECAAILNEASARADALIADAWRRARARLHARVLAERAGARARLQAARAERDTRARAAGERFNARLLELAWPGLQQMLLSRWQHPETRRAWTSSAVAQALLALPSGQWTIRHPADWDRSERRAVAAQVGFERARPLHFLADGHLEAGLVILCGESCLDASLEGLLRDRRRLEARLLALMAQVTGTEDRP